MKAAGTRPMATPIDAEARWRRATGMGELIGEAVAALILIAVLYGVLLGG